MADDEEARVGEVAWLELELPDPVPVGDPSSLWVCGFGQHHVDARDWSNDR